MGDQDEKLWLVGEDDLPIGEGWQWRSYELKGNWKNFRVVNAFVRRPDGKLWIPRRCSTKKMFPLCLDLSVSGHVEYPESYEEAFKREAMEEIGVDVNKVETKFLGMLSPFDIPELSAFMKVWEIYIDQEPEYNRQDFCEAYWLTPDELRAKLEKADKGKGDLIHIVNTFYPKEMAS